MKGALIKKDLQYFLNSDVSSMILTEVLGLAIGSGDDVGSLNLKHLKAVLGTILEKMEINEADVPDSQYDGTPIDSYPNERGPSGQSGGSGADGASAEQLKELQDKLDALGDFELDQQTLYRTYFRTNFGPNE